MGILYLGKSQRGEQQIEGKGGWVLVFSKVWKAKFSQELVCIEGT